MRLRWPSAEQHACDSTDTPQTSPDPLCPASPQAQSSHSEVELHSFYTFSQVSDSSVRFRIVPGPAFLTHSQINISNLNCPKWSLRTSLSVQWLGLCPFTAEGPGSIPGRGTKIPQALWYGKKKKKKKRQSEVWSSPLLLPLSHFPHPGKWPVYVGTQAENQGVIFTLF